MVYKTGIFVKGLENTSRKNIQKQSQNNDITNK